jgi:hypothetical protein
MSFKIEKITYAYLMETGAEKSVDFGKVWDAIHRTFNCAGDGEGTSDRAGFVAGVFGPEHRWQHRALFEKYDNLYEICIHEKGMPQRMEITYRGKESDLQYAQKDMAEIAMVVNQVIEKDAALKRVKQA